MKRIRFLVVTFLVMSILSVVAVFLLAAPDEAPQQFKGFVTITTSSGQPAPQNTEVKAYLGGQLKGQTFITTTNGFYAITGEDAAFPTGTYRLRADDGGRFGESTCSHTQGTTTDCDIVLDTAY